MPWSRVQARTSRVEGAVVCVLEEAAVVLVVVLVLISSSVGAA